MITTILLSRKEQENLPSESHLPMKEHCFLAMQKRRYKTIVKKEKN
jgi:hypothetical protein